jgi:hypothetical protein
MKYYLTIVHLFTLLLCSSGCSFAQIAKSFSTDTTKPYKPEIFTSGFTDIINNGQINASARFIRLFIGEPGKFLH